MRLFVIIITPGPIDTDMASSIGLERFAQRVAPTKICRVGAPEKVALFLASDISSPVTRQTIDVDGDILI